MEVEFEVKITPGILYDYLLYHNYTSMSGIIGNCVGALMVVGAFYTNNMIMLIAGLIVLIYLPWSLFLASRKQMLGNEAFKNPLHYKMNEEGIEVSQVDSVGSQEWGTFYKAISTGKSIIIYTNEKKAAILPKKDLGELLPSVIEMISTHMSPSKVKIR